jgi:hypothetical protein
MNSEGHQKQQYFTSKMKAKSLIEIQFTGEGGFPRNKKNRMFATLLNQEI